MTNDKKNSFFLWNSTQEIKKTESAPPKSFKTTSMHSNLNPF